MSYSLLYEKLSHTSLQCAKKSSAHAWGRLKLPSAPSPFSYEVLTAARSIVRTRRPVRVGPECWQSDSSQVLSLCQHSWHRLTGCRVRATDRAAVKPSCENGDGINGSFQVSWCTCPDPWCFARLSDFCENFSDTRLYDTKNAPSLTHFLKGPPNHKTECISLKISMNITQILGILSKWKWHRCDKNATKTILLFRISSIIFFLDTQYNEE